MSSRCYDRSINTVGDILGAGKPFFMQLSSAQIPRKTLYFYFAINKQLQSLAESQWKYQLFIDGKEINVANDIQISKSELEIKLVETQAPYAILPIEIHNKGQLSSHIRKNINVSPENYEIIAPAGTNTDSLIYKFDNVSQGTIIELTITNELKGRLGLDKNTINIEIQ